MKATSPPALQSYKAKWQLLALAFVLLTPRLCFSAPYPQEGLATVWTQRDGQELKLRVFGDEFYGRTTTEDGFTVLFDASAQNWYYAEKGETEGSLVSTGVEANRKPPSGLIPHLSEGSDRIQEKRSAMIRDYAPERAARWKEKVALASQASGASLSSSELDAAPLIGAQAGLTILVQFPDDPLTTAVDPVNFPSTRAKMQRWSNETGYTDDGNTGSVKDYFYDQSNGALTLTQLVTAVVTMPRPRSFYNYSDYPSNQTVRPDAGVAGRLLVTDAINKLKDDGFNFDGLSLDASNRVLATSLLFAGADSGNWAKGLWPHAWTLASGINVGTAAAPRYIQRYQITNQANNTPVIGTFIHELGHLLLDYPDLYDTNSGNGSSEGVGQHCLMGSGNFQNGGRTPAPINLYLKSVSGWGNITDLTPGTLLDTVLPSTGNVGYRIRKPGRATEYFLAENRGTGDKWTNGSLDRGIVIWHVDELVNGNTDQQMTSSNHYEVSVEQSDGRFDLENDNNRGDSTDFFDNASPFLTNDTNPDADWWDGNASGIRIEITSPAGASMNLRFGGAVPANYLGVSPTLVNIPSTGGTFSFTVSASGTWTWTRSGALITTSETVQQTGIQTFTYSVANNPGAVVRQHTITFTSGALTAVYTIVQAGIRIDDYGNSTGTATVMAQNASLAGEINYALDVDYFRVNVTGSGALTLQTSGTTDTYGFLLSASGQVLAQDDDSGADSNCRISYPVSAGTYYIAIQHYLNDQTGPYTITTNFASGITLSANPTSRAVSGAGGAFDFEVNSNSVWTWSSNAAWVTAPEESFQQNGPQSFTYSVAPQTASSARTAVITLTSGAVTSTHTITQAAAVADDHGNTLATATPIATQSSTAGVIGIPGDEDYFRLVIPSAGTLTLKTTGSLDTEGFLLSAAGATLASDDDDIDSNFLIDWQVTAGTYYLKVNAYSSSDVGAYNVVSTFVAAPFLSLTTAVVAAPAAGGSQTVEVSANTNWTWTISHPWVTAPGEALNQSNVQTFDYLIAANPLSVSRSATITFSAVGVASAVITITQPSAGPVISQQPVGVNVQPGIPAVLTVVTPTPSVSYQWYAGNVGDTSVPVPDAVASSLTIAPGQTMSYWVRLSNLQGSTDSAAAVVTLNTLPAGVNWVSGSSGSGVDLHSIIWTGKKFVIVDASGGVRTSVNGLSWVNVLSPLSSLRSVAGNENLLVAVGDAGIVTSPNGITWTARSIGVSAPFYQVVWSGSAFWVTSSAGISSSSDGVVWQNHLGVAGGISTLRYLDGTFCGVGPDLIATSTNGLVWTTRLTGTGMQFQDVASNGDQWIATAFTGAIWRSANRGVSWAQASSIPGSQVTVAASDGVSFILAGVGSSVMTSADGAETWVPRTVGSFWTLNSLAWNGSQMIAVGNGGAILRSVGTRPIVQGASYYAWATSHGITGGRAAPGSDADGDGQLNASEFLHGSSPAQASQRTALDPEIFVEQGVTKIRLRYPYNPGANYLNPVLQKSSDGAAWDTLVPQVVPDGTGYTLRHDWNASLNSVGQRSFFRFKYLVP